jgi:hypothetical protein
MQSRDDVVVARFLLAIKRNAGAARLISDVPSQALDVQ